MKRYCVICGNELNSNQKKFCSNKCKTKDFYQKHKKQSSFYQAIKYINKKLQLINMKGGKCEICGYNKNLSALEFHHINPNEKKFNIDGRNISNKSMKSLIEESQKCKLLCSNCHKETHFSHYELNETKKLLNDNKHLIKEKKEYFCKKCNKQLSEQTKSGYCKECYNKIKCEHIPPKEILLSLLENNSYNKIGKIYGVSHAAVKKWCIKYKIIN